MLKFLGLALWQQCRFTLTFNQIKNAMIKALIFDLDGTLIQTEMLKATSYALAIAGLTKKKVAQQEVMAVFGKYVGLSRKEVVKGISAEFASELKPHLGSKGPKEIEEAVITERLSLYQAMLNDRELLARHFCPYNLSLLKKTHLDGYHIVLATMSHREQAERVLSVMGIKDKLDLILAREDVAQGKPDPEIYLKAKDRLDVSPRECIVIEDSVNGIKAGLAAEMYVFAVTNDVTRPSVHAAQLLADSYIVDNLQELVPGYMGLWNQFHRA